MSAPEQVVSSVETSTNIITLRADGIFFVQVKDNAEIGIDEVKETWEAFDRMVGEGDCLVMVDSGNGAVTTKESREFASSAMASRPILAEAIIVNNIAHRFAAKFYISFYKPNRPTKIFSNQEEAVKWLKQFARK